MQLLLERISHILNLQLMRSEMCHKHAKWRVSGGTGLPPSIDKNI